MSGIARVFDPVGIFNNKNAKIIDPIGSMFGTPMGLPQKVMDKLSNVQSPSPAVQAPASPATASAQTVEPARTVSLSNTNTDDSGPIRLAQSLQTRRRKGKSTDLLGVSSGSTNIFGL